MECGLSDLGFLVAIAVLFFGAPLLLLWCPVLGLALAFLAIIAVGIAPSEDSSDYELALGMLSLQ
jgi:hypothetical protein